MGKEMPRGVGQVSTAGAQEPLAMSLEHSEAAWEPQDAPGGLLSATEVGDFRGDFRVGMSWADIMGIS